MNCVSAPPISARRWSNRRPRRMCCAALEPVFQAMLENAVRLCDAKFGILRRYDNEAFDPVALFGAPEALADFVRQRGRFQPSAGTALDLILRTKEIVRIDDAMKEPALST